MSVLSTGQVLEKFSSLLGGSRSQERMRESHVLEMQEEAE